MYSGSIIKSPFTLFLGAGASRPLGKLLVVEFIDHLENERGFKGRPLFEEIVGKKRDLEFLLEELDEWIGKDYYAPPPKKRMLGAGNPTNEVPRRLGSGEERHDFLQRFREVLEQARNLRSELRREIFRAYREIGDPEPAVKLFQPVIDAVSANKKTLSYPLVIFTTNYDPSIESYCQRSAAKYSLHDGFFHDADATTYVWKRSEFDEFQLSVAKRYRAFQNSWIDELDHHG